MTVPLAGGPSIGFAESDNVEFKESWSDRALKDLCAFANTKGGVLYVGVRDDGTVVGTAADDAQQLLVANQCDTKLHVTPAVEVEAHGGRRVLAVVVRPASRLVRFEGRYYKRVGTASVEMAEDEAAERLVAQAGRTWDALPAAAATIADDIDAEAVRAFVRRAQGREHPRLPQGVRDSDPVALILGNLDLLAGDGRPTNAAVLLFGRRPQRHVRAALVRMAYFRSVNDFTAYPDCTGTVFEQIETALRQVESANPPTMSFDTSGSTTGGGERVADVRRREALQYPVHALREAITNAVVHRDYMRAGAEVEVKMFPDRLVVSNPGGLLPGVTVEALRQAPHRSERRNPLIAATLFADYWVERYGTGTTRMIELCRAASLPEPEFVAEPGSFAVTFRKDAFTPELLAERGLNERQIQGVLYARAHGSITNRTYRELVGVSPRQATVDLRGLEEARVLVRRGGGRSARYELSGKA
jgi:ATP-dependent DNA helicase RecG